MLTFPEPLETLRLVGHTYEYWNRGRPGVDAVR